MNIFDCQVNYGVNVYGPNNNLKEYIKKAPKQIKEATIIPTGTHVINLNKKVTETSCIWVTKNKKNYFFSILKDKNGLSKKVYFPTNPYYNINKQILNKVKELNKKSKRLYHFAPKFHPRLDKINKFREFLMTPEVIGVKINGIATFSSSKNVKKDFINLIKNKLPLLVHTDYRDPKYRDNSPLSNIVMKNQALNWVNFGLKNNLKIYLAHGARLCKKSIDIVNKKDNFLIGIGPDFMLNMEQEHLKAKGDYLNILFDLADPEKLAFNTDFAWNFKSKDNLNEKDWDSIQRIKRIMIKKGLGHKIKKVFYYNAKGFFKRDY